MSTETIAPPLSLLEAKAVTGMTYEQIAIAAGIGASTARSVLINDSQPHFRETVRQIVHVLNSALPKERQLDYREVSKTFATKGRRPGIAESGRLYVQAPEAPETCPEHYVTLPLSGICDECD